MSEVVKSTEVTGVQENIAIGSTIEPARKAKPSLRKRTMMAALWSSGHGFAQQGLRLASNLLMTRILLPDVFGLMAIVMTTIQLMQAFSDVGIGPSIIQNKRGGDPKFLNTAWTIQVMRGFGLWGVGCVLAWPMAWYYDMPMLQQLLPVACLKAVFNGFTSTSVNTARRQMVLGRVVMLELVSRFIGVAIMVWLVYVYESVWCLVVGNLISSFLQCVGSHLVLPGIRNRFEWDKQASWELIHFGKWIFLSTFASFMIVRADPLIIGRFVTDTELGVLAIALIWPRAVTKFLSRALSNVMLPLFSRLSDRGHDVFYNRTRQIRFALIIPTFLPLWVLVCFAPQLISFMYPQEYHDAGWMVQIIAVSFMIQFCFDSGRDILLSQGDSKLHMLIVSVNLTAKLIGMAIGGSLAGLAGISGLAGILWGAAISPVVGYPLSAWALRKHRMWMPLIDLISVVFGIVIVVLGLWAFGDWQIPFLHH